MLTDTKSQLIMGWFFYPTVMLSTMSQQDKKQEVKKMLTVTHTSPEDRYTTASVITTLFGLMIPLTTGVMGVIGLNFGIATALQFTIAPYLFLFSGYLILSYRMSHAFFDKRTWTKLKKINRESEYVKGKHAYKAIPYDRDLILPLIITTIGTPIILASGVLTSIFS